MNSHYVLKSLFILTTIGYCVASFITKNRDNKDAYRFLALWCAIWGFGVL